MYLKKSYKYWEKCGLRRETKLLYNKKAKMNLAQLYEKLLYLHMVGAHNVVKEEM